MAHTRDYRRILLSVLFVGVVIVLGATLVASRSLLLVITPDNVDAVAAVRELPDDIYDIVWTADGERVAFVRWEKPVEIRNAKTLRVEHSIGEDRKIIAFAFSPQPDIVAFCENAREVEILNTSTGASLHLRGLNQQPQMRFSPDGELLATGGYGTKASVFDAQTGELRWTLDTGAREGGLTPVFSADGHRIAVGNRNWHTSIFDATTGTLVYRLSRGSTQGLAFHPDGTRLAVSYVDGHVGLWDLSDGQLLHLEKAGEEIYRVAWSPDGSVLASCGRAADVVFWNPKDMSVLARKAVPDWVIGLSFRPDGRQLLMAGGTGVPGGRRSLSVLGVRLLDWLLPSL